MSPFAKRGSFFLSVTLAISASTSAQICTPNGVIQGSTTLASGKVIVGTTACAEVTNPQGSRFQVLGNSGATNALNYAATILMPALATIPLPGQIFGIVGRSGATGTASGTGSTAGLFEAWGGEDNTSGVVVNAKLDHATGTSGVNVYGVKAEASTNQSITGGNLYGLFGSAAFSSGGSSNVATGVYGRTGYLGTGTVTTGHAVNGYVYGGPTYTTAYALKGELQSTVSATNSFGVHGYCPAGATRYGVYGEATNAGTFTKLYGVYGKSPIIQSVPVTDWNSVTSWAGYFAGHVQVTGSFTSGSDLKLKKDIKPLNEALSLIERLSPKTYSFDAAKFPSMNLPAEPQFGLIAQEVQKVIPELVLHAIHPEVLDSTGDVVQPAVDYLTMNYQGLIPILLSGIQEQQDNIQGLEETVAVKQAQVDKLTARLEAIEKQLGITPQEAGKSEGKAQLEQNAPNPFNESTIIRFHVPEGTSSASIQVTSSDGKVVSSFASLRSGQGQVIIAASSLGAGTYTYALLVDGVKADSKTMVITR